MDVVLEQTIWLGPILPARRAGEQAFEGVVPVLTRKRDSE